MTIVAVPDALDECAREPIHIPGAIQPHGALLAITMPGLVITHLSANCETFLRAQPGSLALGTDLRDVFSRTFVHDLGNTLQAASIGRIPERLAGTRIVEGGVSLDVIAHVTADGAVCEFMSAASVEHARLDPSILLRAMVARLSRATDVGRLLSLATQQVRAVTGYDRVMIYKFRPDGSGVVVAESVRGGLEPYLGLHYPASDIPPQARELYRRQPLRLIPDVNYLPVPVLPLGPETRPLDLSLAHLRSVSPIHLEYLRNMGSAGTLTISIMRGGLLWGLFSCHHEQPRYVTATTCAALELFAQMFSLQLEAKEQALQLSEMSRANAILEKLRNDGADRPVSEAIGSIRRDLAEVIPHDGLALWVDGQGELFGSTPPADRLPELLRHIAASGSDGAFASDRLSAELPDALLYTEQASGVLAVPLSRGRRDYLLFFRKEQVQTVAWGGDPNKPVTRPGDGRRIGPRQSFAAWREVVRGASVPWRDTEIHVAEALQVRVLEFLLTYARAIDENRRATAESQSLLIAELGHRVKNILALIRSVVRQSSTGAESVESFTADLERRIAALSLAHDQVTQVGWRPASLRRLLEGQARTWSTEGAQRFVLEGPPVLIDVHALQAFALVLHEMMTNAAKYGALSTPDGKVIVTWNLDGRGLLIRWRERGGPPVLPPARRGFGTVVIEQTIPFEIKGLTDIRYEPGGVEADFLIPAECAILSAKEDGSVGPSPALVIGSLRGKRLLLVEDSMMIALDAQASLEGIGAAVEIVSSVADGLRAIDLSDFDLAVLDINLHGETSTALAETLFARKIPFVFATGYGDRIHIPDVLKHIPKVPKPYDAAAIALGLERAVLASLPR